eukprot:gb/GECG01010241.1/.p1 GENE.gb/GECG01010241.1/~~gb/GECG01010241.1/.p1  ORF type:complete len:734 (+),score=87.14 gb/GECG01010241.1/:1-2202(+)
MQCSLTITMARTPTKMLRGLIAVVLLSLMQNAGVQAQVDSLRKGPRRMSDHLQVSITFSENEIYDYDEEICSLPGGSRRYGEASALAYVNTTGSQNFESDAMVVKGFPDSRQEFSVSGAVAVNPKAEEGSCPAQQFVVFCDENCDSGDRLGEGVQLVSGGHLEEIIFATVQNDETGKGGIVIRNLFEPSASPTPSVSPSATSTPVKPSASPTSANPSASPTSDGAPTSSASAGAISHSPSETSSPSISSQLVSSSSSPTSRTPTRSPSISPSMSVTPSMSPSVNASDEAAARQLRFLDEETASPTISPTTSPSSSASMSQSSITPSGTVSVTPSVTRSSTPSITLSVTGSATPSAPTTPPGQMEHSPTSSKAAPPSASPTHSPAETPTATPTALPTFDVDTVIRAEKTEIRDDGNEDEDVCTVRDGSMSVLIGSSAYVGIRLDCEGEESAVIAKVDSAWWSGRKVSTPDPLQVLVKTGVHSPMFATSPSRTMLLVVDNEGSTGPSLCRIQDGDEEGVSCESSEIDLSSLSHIHDIVWVGERTVIVYGGSNEKSTTSWLAIVLQNIDASSDEVTGTVTEAQQLQQQESGIVVSASLVSEDLSYSSPSTDRKTLEGNLRILLLWDDGGNRILRTHSVEGLDITIEEGDDGSAGASEDSGLSVGAIAGIAAGGALVIGISIALGAVLCKKRGRGKNAKSGRESNDQVNPVGSSGGTGKRQAAADSIQYQANPLKGV